MPAEKEEALVNVRVSLPDGTPLAEWNTMTSGEHVVIDVRSKSERMRDSIESQIRVQQSRLRLWKMYEQGMPDPVAKALTNQVIWDMEQVVLALASLHEFILRRESKPPHERALSLGSLIP
jgi:hypothetical protein